MITNRKKEATAIACAEKSLDSRYFDVASWCRKYAENEKKHTGGRKRKTRRRRYLTVPAAFDIETSRIGADADGNPNTIMYIWQMQLGLDCTIYGRYWQDFLAVVRIIADTLYQLDKQTEDDWRLVCYVHNLSHEFQYFAGIWKFAPEDVFVVRSRKILKCDMGKLEMRCSMLQTNMSLAAFTAKMGAPHAKAVGDLDYSVTRYPWTDLTEQEMHYCVNDVRGLVESIMIEMQNDGDDLYTIPMTSTGYVRRDARAAIYQYGIKYIRRLLPDYETYKALRDAFRGGDTHANRYYVGITLHDVKSVDMSSAYPAVQCECRFPVSPLRREPEPNVQKLKTALKYGKAVLMRVAIWGLKQLDPRWGMPYIPLAKCAGAVHYVNDNGRLLSAEYLEITITDVDYKIILAEYSYTGLQVLDMWTAAYGELPRKLQEVIKYYFTAKTTLKGVEGQEYLYMKSKNKLNSVYGMTAQDPLPACWHWTGTEFENCDPNPAATYEENKEHLFLPYQWGVWTTAHTRRRLKIAQHAAGEGCVYCDTDSVKYVGECNLDKYNHEVVELAEFSGCCAKDPSGHKHYMGVYEQEKTYAEFKTWGAKKYATTYEIGGPITTTIAGVNKKIGGQELAEHGGLEAFRPGFTFEKASGKLIVYNDDPDMPPIIGPDGQIVEVTRNLSICDNTYTVGITDEYASLLGLQREVDV